MIKQILSLGELERAFGGIKPDILSGKIKALGRAYGFSYSFLKFFGQTDGRSVISVYYGSAVICGEADEEAAIFCKQAGVSEILMPEAVYTRHFSEFSAEQLYIMEYKGGIFEPEKLSADTSYEKIFEILRDGFDISFEDWYPDMCHNVRHGISEVFTLEDKATATKMFSEDGLSLISLVAVKKEHKGKGLGARIVRSASERLALKDRVFVICKGELVPFYSKNGYKICGNCRQLSFI